MKKLWVANHEHVYGNSINSFKTNKDGQWLEENKEEVCKALDINFEPDRNEVVEFYCVEDNTMDLDRRLTQTEEN